MAKTVRIVRSRWLRGRAPQISGLHIANHKQCCLGFVARAYGCSIDEIRGCGRLEELYDEAQEKLPAKLVNDEASFIDVNDSEDITDRERESKLRSLAKRHGMRFVFVDR